MLQNGAYNGKVGKIFIVLRNDIGFVFDTDGICNFCGGVGIGLVAVHGNITIVSKLII